MIRVFTSSYEKCKAGNRISISGDRGKGADFNGKSIPELAPKRAFWNVWHDNIGKISEETNTRYYIREYYKQVLSKINIEELLKGEKDPILLCYEDSLEFCHRHIVAEYIKMKYKIEVLEIEVSETLEIKENKRPENIKKILTEIIKEESQER